MDLSNLEPVTLTCPRCHARVEQRLYGPCVNCVAELREKYPGVARDVETDDYIPTMNVTPNAVATKD